MSAAKACRAPDVDSQCVFTMQLDDRPLEEPLLAYILREVLQALLYLHGEHRVHRDIKAANVLLSADGAVKISDFGVSGQLTGISLPTSLQSQLVGHR